MKFIIFILVFSFSSFSIKAKWSFQEAMKKDGPLPQAYEVENPLGKFKMPSIDKKITSLAIGKRTYQLVSNIGSGAELVCFLGDTALVATTIHNLKNAIFNNKKDLNLLGISKVKVGRSQRSPYVNVNYLYKVKSKNTIGLVKIFIANVYNNNIRCIHDQLGFLNLAEESFKTILDSFVPKKGPSAHLKSNDIFRIDLQKNHIGFSQIRKFDEGNGNKTFYTNIFMIFSTPSKKMIYSDSFIKQSVDKKDEILKSTYITNINGLNSSFITLKKTKKNIYNVSGTLNKKKIKGEINFKRSFFSDEKIQHLISEKIKNKDFKDFEVSVYNASAAPLKALTGHYSLIENKDKRAKVKLKVDNMDFLYHYKNQENIQINFLNKSFPATFIKLKK